MKNKLLLLLIVSLFNMQSHGQEIDKAYLDERLHEHYPSPEAPGISIHISKGGIPIYSFQKGLAYIEKQEKITRTTRFRMASVSKQVTARAVYRLAEHNKLNLDQPLSMYFSHLPDSWQQVTPRHLLTHTSGIWDYEDLIPDGQQAQLTDKDVLRLSKLKDQLYFSPGTQFRYSNTGYCLLALLVEKVAQKPFADFVQKQLFQPIGILDGLVYNPQSVIKNRAYGYHPTGDHFRFADQSLTSATQGDGGVYFSVEDYHRWASARLFNDFDNADFINSFQENAIPVHDGIAYNLGLFLFRDNNRQLHLFHSGESTGFNNIIYIVPHQELIISIFTNRDDLSIATAFEETVQHLKLPKVVPNHLFIWLNKVYANNF